MSWFLRANLFWATNLMPKSFSSWRSSSQLWEIKSSFSNKHETKQVEEKMEEFLDKPSNYHRSSVWVQSSGLCWEIYYSSRRKLVCRKTAAQPENQCIQDLSVKRCYQFATDSPFHHSKRTHITKCIITHALAWSRILPGNQEKADIGNSSSSPSHLGKGSRAVEQDHIRFLYKNSPNIQMKSVVYE